MGSEQTGPREVGPRSVLSSRRVRPVWVRPEFEVISTGLELSAYAATASTISDI